MKILAMVFIMTLWVDNILPLVLARFYPNYSHREMALSVLGSRQSPVKWVYNLWCIASGVVFCAAPYLVYDVSRSGLAVAIWVLLAVYGVGCEIISGFCPLNERREDEDALTKIHGGGSAIGFMTLLFAPAVLSILQFRGGEVAWGAVSLACFVAAFVFFCFFIMGEKEKFAGTVLRYGGLWQRLVLLACYLPLFIWCLNFLI